MAMNDASLQRIHDFTANYFFWQGLRGVPLGAGLLVLSLQPGKWLPFGRWGQALAGALAITIALALSNEIGRWYRRKFGAVRSDASLHARRDLLKWTVFYPLIVTALIVDGWWRPPILMSGIAWAAAIAAYWASTGRGRNHYVVISAVFALSTFAPLMFELGSRVQRLSFIVALIGLVYMAAGILNHLALLRMLQGTEADDAGAV